MSLHLMSLMTLKSMSLSIHVSIIHVLIQFHVPQINIFFIPFPSVSCSSTNSTCVKFTALSIHVHVFYVPNVPHIHVPYSPCPSFAYTYLFHVPQIDVPFNLKTPYFMID